MCDLAAWLYTMDLIVHKIHRKYKCKPLIKRAFKCLSSNHHYFRFRFTKHRLQWNNFEFRAKNVYLRYIKYKETYARGSQPPQVAIRVSRYKLVARGFHLTKRQLRCLLIPSPQKTALHKAKCKYRVVANNAFKTAKFTRIPIYYVYQYKVNYTRVFEPVLINATGHQLMVEDNKRVLLLLVFDDNG